MMLKVEFVELNEPRTNRLTDLGHAAASTVCAAFFLYQQCRQLREGILHEQSLQLLHHELTESLDCLQYDISGEAVGDEHVAVAGHYALSLDVADEV